MMGKTMFLRFSWYSLSRYGWTYRTLFMLFHVLSLRVGWCGFNWCRL